MLQRAMILAVLWVLTLGGDTDGSPNASRLERTIEVDASTRRLVQAPRSIEHGCMLVLRVTNPNHFRDEYELTLNRVDLHGFDIPAVLRTLVWSSPAIVNPLPESISLLSNVGGTQAIRARLNGLPHSLDDSFTNVIVQLRQMQFEAENLVKDADGGMLAIRYQHLLRCTKNNASGRLVTLELGAMIARNVIRDPGLSRRFDDASSTAEVDPDTLAALQGMLGQFVPALLQKAEGWKSDWREAKEEWNRSLAGFAGVVTADSSAKDAIEAAKQQIASGDEWVAGLTSTVGAVRRDLELFVALATVALDPVQCPDIAERRAVADGDEVIAGVTIRTRSNGVDSIGAPKAAVTTVSVRIPVSDRWSFGASGGIAATGLVDRNYVLRPVPGDPNAPRIVREGSRDDVDARPAFMLHYLRTGLGGATSWGFGPSFGVTVGEPVRYLTGCSIFFGRTLRLVLTGGLAVGRVSVLNGDRVGKPLTGESLETKSVVHKCGFGGMSLSIGLPAVDTGD